jgi:hypothetical protein
VLPIAYYQKVIYYMKQCCQSAKRSGSVFRKRSVESVIFKKSSEAKHPRRVYYIYIYIYIYIIFYIYCVYIKKNMQKDKLAAECMKTCISVHCNIKMASIVVSSSTSMIKHSSINHLESSNYKLTNQHTNF